VTQRCEQLRLTLEPRGAIRVERQRLWKDFDRDLAAQFRVARTIDLAHAARAERVDDLVHAAASAGRQWHGALHRGL